MMMIYCLSAYKSYSWISPDTQLSTDQQNHNNPPNWPSVFRALRGSVDDAWLKTSSNYEVDTKPGRTIMINDEDGDTPHWFVINSERGDHPMHLHGHHFQILAKMPAAWFDADSVDLYDWVTTTDRNGLSTSNPARRDTLFIEKGATYVIAVKPDNPGVWAFHCHNDIHAASGMFSQVVEKPKALRALLGTWTWSSTVPRLSFTSGTNTVLNGAGPSGFLRTSMDFALASYGWPQINSAKSTLKRETGRLLEKAFWA
jgi:hypothetical protein